MGVHQKIDRVARRRIAPHVPSGLAFPSTKEILHFEGLNGPDGIKRKSPAKDEPWHYIDPTRPNDTALLDMIDEHIRNLTHALDTGNITRAAFEAAWMAHAITDGLTPPHHYPLAQKLEQLRGSSIETRTSAKEKIILPGQTRWEQLANNWEVWGAKGVMTSHFGFELGVAMTVAGANLKRHQFGAVDKLALEAHGFRPLYRALVDQVFAMHMYTTYQKYGWTTALANQTKQELIPLIIKAVCLGWYSAIMNTTAPRLITPTKAPEPGKVS